MWRINTFKIKSNLFLIGRICFLAAFACIPRLYGQISIIASDPLSAPHFLQISTEKIANTFIFSGICDALLTLPAGSLSIRQNYRGVAIRTGASSFRDDQQLTAEYSLPISDTTFSLIAKGFWQLSKDSRSIGLSSLSIAGGAVGSNWRLNQHSSAGMFAGVENMTQLGMASPGALFGLNTDFRSIDLGDFTGDFIFSSSYAKFDHDRSNTDVDITAIAERPSENGNLARLAASYRRIGRDYYLPIGTDGVLDIESRVENRAEITAEVKQPIYDNILTAEGQAFLGNIIVNRQFLTPKQGIPLTYIGRGMSEFSLNISAAIRLHLPTIQFYGGFSQSLRDEINDIKAIFDIAPADKNQLQQSEFQRDNSSSRTRAFWQFQWKASPSDTLLINGSASIFRYDTPSSLNYDDRDELLINFSLEKKHRFSLALTASAGLSVQQLHTVFIKSQRSSLNNQNRILKFIAKVECITPSSEFRPNFEVLANYTAYDFENMGGARSFSFRQISARDSIIIFLYRNVHAEARLFGRYFLTGQLDWQNFSETPLNVNYEQFIKILIFTRPFSNASLGVGMRYYALSQQSAGSIILPGNFGSSLQQFYGPEMVMDIRFTGGTRLLANGWHETQYINRKLLRNLPNLFLTVQTPL